MKIEENEFKRYNEGHFVTIPQGRVRVTHAIDARL
jgi:hypothetical protein